MARLGIPAARSRVALIAVLAALAAMAIATPVAASAADHSVSLSCTPATVDTGATTNCRATVTPKGSAPVATGNVAFFVTGWTGYLKADEQLCNLQPIGGGAAACSLLATGYTEGEENVIAHYPATGPPESREADNFELTFRGGSLRVFCEERVIVEEEPTECQAYVPTAPGASPATGSVAFGSASRFSFHHPGKVEPECQLEPIAEGAGCSVTFQPPFAGEYAVLGEYGGDGIYPADRGTGFAKALNAYQTTSEVSCDDHLPFLFTLVECTTTVTSIFPPLGPSPVGVVSYKSSGAGSFPGPTGKVCHVKPISAQQSACKVVYRPEALEPQTVRGIYIGNGQFDFSEDSFDLDVHDGRFTEMSLACEAGKVGVARRCTATVRDVESKPTASPTGTVTFSGKAEFNLNPCKLQPLPGVAGVSQCAVSYKPSSIGSLALRAEYRDDALVYRPSKAEALVSVQPPF